MSDQTPDYIDKSIEKLLANFKNVIIVYCIYPNKIRSYFK